MGYIYCLFNTKNGKRYIGQTSQDIMSRINQHVRETARVINKALKKHGAGNFSLQYWKVPDEQLNTVEMSLIKQLNTKSPNGYNMTDGGDGLCGYKHSKETKLKISKKNKGKSTWNKGLKSIYSENTLRKMSLSNIGKLPWNKNIKTGKPAWNRNIPHSEETINKISENKKALFKDRNNHPMRKAIILIHPDGTEEKFDCIMDACDKYNIPKQGMNAVLHCKVKTCRNFKAKYLPAVKNG